MISRTKGRHMFNYGLFENIKDYDSRGWGINFCFVLILWSSKNCLLCLKYQIDKKWSK